MPESAANDLLATLEPLDFPTRSRRLKTEALRLAEDSSVLEAVLDAFAAGGAYERELGLKMALVARRTDRVIAALDDPLYRIRALALYACVGRRGAGTDAAILATLEDAPLQWRRTVVRMVVSAGRTDLADRLAEGHRDQLGDADTARLLPACSAKVAERLLPGLAHKVRCWTRLGTRHPALMLEFSRRELATVPAGSREQWWTRHDQGLVAAAEVHADQVLDLLEEFPLPQGLPDAFLRQISLLTRADEGRVLRLLTVADSGLAGRWGSLSHTARKQLVRSGRPEIVPVGRALRDQQRAFADLLWDLAPSARSEFYDAVTAGLEKDAAIIPEPVLEALPRRRRHAEARRMLTLAAFTDRPDQRLWVVAQLPWDEAREELRTAVRHASAWERKLAYPHLVTCAAAQDHPPIVTSLLTEELIRLRNEQDPVRREALSALAVVPACLFEDTPAVADALRKAVTDALQARDCSLQTRESVRRLASRILAQQVTDDPDRARGTVGGDELRAGADSRSLLAWSLSTLDQLAGTTSQLRLGRLDRNLRRGQELAVYEALRPWIERGMERADHRLVIALAQSLGERARAMPGLQAAIAHAIWHGTAATAAGAIRLWMDDPALRDARVEQLIAWDPTAATNHVVAGVLSRRRTDLLDAFLTDPPTEGKFIATGGLWVARLQPSHRWLPRQLTAYARLVATVAADEGATIERRVTAINHLGAGTGEGQGVVLRHLDSPDVPIAEAALRMLSRGDDPVGALPILLGHAGGDRARVAVYAAGHAARFVRPSEAAPLLRSVVLSPTTKITSRKEALRIAADIEIPGLVDLLETVWRTPGQHRDVKAAAVLRLAGRLDDERVPALLREAAGDDPAIAVQLLRTLPAQLAERHRGAYGELVATAADAEDPKVSGMALAAAAQWYRWSQGVATVVCTAMTDLARLGDRVAPPSALFALLAEGMPATRYRAVLESLLAADARDGTADAADARGTHDDRSDDRDRPARRRLVSIAREAAAQRRLGPIERRKILTITAQTLGSRPGYTRLAATLAADAVDLDAAVEEVTGELLEVAAGVSGRCDAAAQTGERLAARIRAGEPWDPAAVLAALEALAARDDPGAGLIATHLAGAAGAKLGWPAEYRTAIRVLRRHADPAVVEAALDLDFGAVAASPR